MKIHNHFMHKLGFNKEACTYLKETLVKFVSWNSNFLFLDFPKVSEMNATAIFQQTLLLNDSLEFGEFLLAPFGEFQNFFTQHSAAALKLTLKVLLPIIILFSWMEEKYTVNIVWGQTGNITHKHQTKLWLKKIWVWVFFKIC